jgi:hypothetical protein
MFFAIEMFLAIEEVCHTFLTVSKLRLGYTSIECSLPLMGFATGEEKTPEKPFSARRTAQRRILVEEVVVGLKIIKM